MKTLEKKKKERNKERRKERSNEITRLDTLSLRAREFGEKYVY